MPDGAITSALLDRTLDEFHRMHEQFYGYSITGEVIELIRFNVEATGATKPPVLPDLPSCDPRITVPSGSRPVVFQGHGSVDCPIVQRDALPAGYTTIGPLIVEEMVSTTLIHPGQRLKVLPSGVISIALN